VRLLRRYGPPVLVLAALLGAWELYVDLGGGSSVVPAAHEVAKALYTDRSLLWSSFLVTAEEVVLGIVVAAVLGLALTLAIHFSRTLRQALYPLLVGSQAIPFPVLAFPLVLLFGFGIVPKLALVAVISFFPIVVTSLAGLAAVDPDLLKLMRTLDASRLRTFWHVELPFALPGVLTGAKIGIAVSVIGAVVAELAGSTSGLGYLYQQSSNQLLFPREYAAVVLLCTFSVALFGLLTLVERLTVPWAYQSRGDHTP
jgi:NitT/TauT family transport system permease protein/putative hydroxymethylpyrimidine transport system permease protein